MSASLPGPGPGNPRTLAVYIGRFQPLHGAHLHTLRAALDRHPRLLVLIGSANLARSMHNPWTAAERARFIRAALREAGEDPWRVGLRPLPDDFDSVRWAARVRAAVQEALARTGTQRAVLTGFEKDASSRYLRWFPEWTADPAPAWPGLNATGVRAAFLGRGEVPPGLPPVVAAFLETFARSRSFGRLAEEHHAVLAARAALAGSPVPGHERLDLYMQGDRVWLARRAGPIGRGLWALRAGPLGPPARGAAVFSHPARSLVWPTTAHVVRVSAPPPDTRPVALAAALGRPRAFYEDHHVILTRLLAGA